MSFKSGHFKSNGRLVLARSNSPPMRLGEANHAVRLVQKALIDLGYKLPISTKKYHTPDGIYGSETKKIVWKFQYDQKLASKDGDVGQQTLSKLDDLLWSRGIKFSPLPNLPPGSPGSHTDEVMNSQQVVLETLGTSNPLRTINFTLSWHQLSTDRKEKITILGRHYDKVASAIFNNQIGVDINYGYKSFAAYSSPANIFIFSRPMTLSMNDRSAIIHEATHAVNDIQGPKVISGLFDEVVAFIAEALFWRKRAGRPKSQLEVYQVADQVAQSIISGDEVDDDIMQDLSSKVRQDPTYGPDTYGLSRYDGID